MSNIDEALPKAPGEKRGLKRAFSLNFKDPKSRTLLVVTGSAAVALVAIVLWQQSSGTQRVASDAPSARSLNSVAGGKEQLENPELAAKIRERNRQLSDRAAMTGASNVPTMDVPTFQTGNLAPQTPAPAPQPLSGRRGPARSDNRQERSPPKPDTKPWEESLKGAFAAWQPQKAEFVSVESSHMKALREMREKQHYDGLAAATAALGGMNGTPGREARQMGRLVARAGDGVFGYLLNGASSRAPNELVAEIVAEGKLLHGTRLIGSPQKTDEGFVIRLSSASLGESLGYGSAQVNALIMNPNTDLPPIATDIDHKYFQRYALKFAAGFVETLGSALGRPRTQFSASPFGGGVLQQDQLSLSRAALLGAGRVGGDIAQDLDEWSRGQDLPIVTLKQDEPVKIVFLRDFVIPETR